MTLRLAYLPLHVLRIKNEERQKRVARFSHLDWKLSAWSNATLGELGEAANVIKKIERGDFNDEGGADKAKEMLAKELADTLVYLDILARKAGIDLAEAVTKKFNEVSEREGVPDLLINSDYWYDGGAL